MSYGHCVYVYATIVPQITAIPFCQLFQKTIMHMFHNNDSVLGHNSALKGYTGLGTNWANEVNFIMNHAPGAGSIPRPVD